MTVVLDTNALMMPVECDVRVFEELQRLLGSVDPIVPAQVLAELESLSGGASEEATAASVGLDLADRCRMVEAAPDYADDAVLAVAQREGVEYALTNDRPLQERLLAAGVPVISLRGEHKLAITHP
ncbi:PIN domain-containing protein [Halapricum hydrolyticum]|uniref:Twitching motility protein PilT n=1 Tax=Halapricum hydrolyticum TaxID=2979991 RepID=A0AAE3ICL1_9EURY|nr:twitching motility protein PilT [Halapricum hydrolyticum]MCU4718967.1 twitching motility protein PilT [Halapricum hydrolyticum]MCU4727896.1 twitching motility protein PilT [Halapricum hydrolyticum]